MPYSFPARRLLFASSVFILFALLSTSARALEMEILPGFDGVTKSLYWTPIGVKLSNPSGRTVEGTLEVRQDSQNRRAMPVCSAKVSLPGNSTKLYYMYTRRTEYGGNMRVALVRGNRVVAAKDLSPMMMSPYDKLVVTVGDRSSKLYFLTGERVPLTMRPGQAGAMAPGYSPSGQTESTVQASAISPAMLPDRPSAYQSVDILVMSDLGPTAPDPKALKSISMWVAGGGTLVVSAGPNYRSFQNEFFDEILPVTITGAGSVPTLGAAAAIAKTAFPGGPVAVSVSTPKPGICTDLVREGTVPVYAERRYGGGRVVFLAFDYKASPFRDWNGQVDFWKSILVASSGSVMIPENLEWMENHGYRSPGSMMGTTTGLGGVVEQNPSVRTPSFNVIAIYLLAYLVCLVPINYLYLKKKRRMELAWISTPAIVVLFTLGAYAIGYTMKGGSIQLGVATVIEGSSNARYARMISDASLFSPARRTYDIELRDPYAVGQCVPQEPSEPIPTAYLGEKTTIENVEMAMWSSKNVESVSGVDLGGVVTSNLRMSGSQLEGTVTNNTSLDLKDCVIEYGGKQKAVGDLKSGGTVNVSRIAAKASPSASGQRSGSYSRDIRARLNGLASASVYAWGVPVLIGFADRKPLYGLEGGRGKVAAETCCMFRLDISMGDTYIFSPAMLPARITRVQNAEPASRPSGAGRSTELIMNLSPGGVFIVSYQLPASGGLELTELMVRNSSSFLYGHGGTPIVKCALRTSDGAWEPVKSPNGSKVPNPGRYLQEGNQVHVRVQSGDSNEVTTSLSISAVGKRK